MQHSTCFRSGLYAACLLAVPFALPSALSAQQIAVTHIQRPLHRTMIARTEDGKTIATGDFNQLVQGDEVTMRLLYRFNDGSIDDETTTYRQHAAFSLVRTHHIESGPFFPHPIDFTVEANGTATTRSTDKAGKTHTASAHVDLPADIANGFVGTLLLNVSPHTRPFRVGLLAPVGSGRMIRLLLSPEGERSFHLAGQPLKATVFRIHPELGGIVGMIAPLIGLQPRDVFVWIAEGDDPAVVRIVGQLGGYGPIVSSELEGATFDKDPAK